MLCHPGKLIPPQQVVKYCGFLLDLRAIPCLRVPVSKRERALAIVDHLLESSMSREYSRLSLVVAAGVLQSLVEATSSRLCHTYLRRFHSMVRPPGLGSGLEPYLTKCCLTAEVKDDLQWWRTYLQHEGGRFAHSVRLATFIPMWAMEAELAPGVHLNCPVGRFICGRANGPQQCSISPPTGRNF
jgi:hypothetical protein